MKSNVVQAPKSLDKWISYLSLHFDYSGGQTDFGIVYIFILATCFAKYLVNSETLQ